MEPTDRRPSRKAVLDKVKHLVYQQLHDIPAKVYLFGSWAREEEKRSSDMDLAIEFEGDEAASQSILVQIRHALEESTIPYKVDVVHLNTADDRIVNKVRKEGILWGEPSKE